jgi:hypothetical protein
VQEEPLGLRFLYPDQDIDHPASDNNTCGQKTRYDPRPEKEAEKDDIVKVPEKDLGRIINVPRDVCHGFVLLLKKLLDGQEGARRGNTSRHFHGKTQGKKPLFLFSGDALTSTLEGCRNSSNRNGRDESKDLDFISLLRPLGREPSWKAVFSFSFRMIRQELGKVDIDSIARIGV